EPLSAAEEVASPEEPPSESTPSDKKGHKHAAESDPEATPTAAAPSVADVPASASSVVPSGLEAPDGVNIGEHLLKMQSERQRLQVMRAQLADELQRMRAGRIDSDGAAGAAQGAGGAGKLANRVKMLRLLVEPGRATSRNVADVLSEIVVLGRLSG